MQTKILFLILLFYVCFDCVFSQSNIDSLIKSQPITKIDKINRARNLLYESIKNKDILLITNLQEYLNNISDANYCGLNIDENFLLYIHLEEWNKALNTIVKMPSPRRINNISISGDIIFFQKELGVNTISIISKEKIINNSFYDNLLNSNITNEQKDFLKIFLPYYLNNYYIQKNNKMVSFNIKSEYTKFRKKYPDSEYLNYINVKK